MTVRIILVHSPAGGEAAGEVVRRNTGEKAWPTAVRARPDDGTSMNLGPGLYRFDFEVNREGDYELQTIDETDARVGGATSIATSAQGQQVLFGWHHDFEVKA